MTMNRRPSILRRRGLKWFAVCLLIGIGIFFIWPRSSLHEADIFVPVYPGKVSEGLTITGPRIKGIEVRVSGPKSVIESLSDQKLRYPIDLSNVTVGVNAIKIQANRISLPGDVSIIKITPSFLTVGVEKEIKKELPVKITYSGNPASGFFIANAVAKPSLITLRGPESVLGPIQEALTKTIDVSGLSESFKKEIAVDFPEGLDAIPHSSIVLAEISIQEKIITKIFADIPVEGKNTAYTYDISPPAIRIEVKGPVNLLDRLESDGGINVYVDLKKLKPGVYVRRAAISLPVKTTLVSVTPEIFTIKIGKGI
jgi:YbbR domain-containing protein